MEGNRQLLLLILIAVAIGRYQEKLTDTCMTVEGPDAGSPCVFPFTTKTGTVHTKCTLENDAKYNDNKFWCSTQTDSQGNHVANQGKWGFCASKGCETEIPGPVNKTIICGFDDNELSIEVPLRSPFYPAWWYVWQYGIIPFYFNGTVTSNDKAVFRRAMGQIETHTCFKFQEESIEPNTHQLEIRVKSSSCRPGFAAYVTSRYKPKIVLISDYQLADQPTCDNEAGVLHELMHALGVKHTQTRKDRENFIKVHQENIIEGMHSQYEICKTCKLYDTIPYDCSSIMHYAYTTFRKGTGPTMTAIDPSTCKLADDINEATDTDWKLLNIIGANVCPGGIYSKSCCTKITMIASNAEWADTELYTSNLQGGWTATGKEVNGHMEYKSDNNAGYCLLFNNGNWKISKCGTGTYLVVGSGDIYLKCPDQATTWKFLSQNSNGIIVDNGMGMNCTFVSESCCTKITMIASNAEWADTEFYTSNFQGGWTATGGEVNGHTEYKSDNNADYCLQFSDGYWIINICRRSDQFFVVGSGDIYLKCPDQVTTWKFFSQNDNGFIVDNGMGMNCTVNLQEQALSFVSDCSSRDFFCEDGECINDSWKCDGEKDCDDGSDESATICPES